MREFHYDQTYRSLLTSEIVPLLAKIHEYKGEQKNLPTTFTT